MRVAAGQVVSSHCVKGKREFALTRKSIFIQYRRVSICWCYSRSWWPLHCCRIHGTWYVLILTPASHLADGKGMPRILLSTAHITPLILDYLGVKSTPPSLVAPYPPVPKPFQITKDRVERLRKVDAAAKHKERVKDDFESSKKSFCNTSRCRAQLSWAKICNLDEFARKFWIV